jgi:hypothetical protein
MKMIWVTFQKKGFHRYPDAPDEVEYLKSVHRHQFHFKVGIEVTHDNRDIEFHMFQTFCESLYEGTIKVDYKSCEMIANDLYEEIAKMYGPLRCFISVAEDLECGAFMTYNFNDSREEVAVLHAAG